LNVGASLGAVQVRDPTCLKVAYSVLRFEPFWPPSSRNIPASSRRSPRRPWNTLRTVTHGSDGSGEMGRNDPCAGVWVPVLESACLIATVSIVIATVLPTAKPL
jgi:hypothetical protein